ncbi:MAG: hypothetical protein IVW51_18025 [Thermaceae bacterium]|nr:hypothetical protein [Thermaceae bacterium]
MPESMWRVRSRQIIRQIIAETGMADMPKLKKALTAAYPFGPRANHPYKIWLNEVRVQLALLTPVPRELVDCRGTGPLFEANHAQD